MIISLSAVRHAPSEHIGTVNNLITEWNSPEGVSLATALDVEVNVGSLFIKSNVVGFGVSAGWLIIKETL